MEGLLQQGNNTSEEGKKAAFHGDQGMRNDRGKTLRRSFELKCYKRRKLFSAPQQQTSTDQTKQGDGWLRDHGGTENSHFTE